MYRFLEIVLFLRPGNSRDPAQTRAGEQMPLKLRNPGGFQPHPLLSQLYPHRAELDFQGRAAFDDGLYNRLARAAFVHVGDQIPINLNSVRLELRQQLQPGKPFAKVIDRHADTRAL